MPRRGLPGVQVVVLIGVVLLFLYGYYSFNEVKSTLRKSEEMVKRAKLDEENLSAQLQALNEQKNQLDESVKQDRESCRKDKDDLIRTRSELEMKCKQEKKFLNDQVNSLSADLSTAKANYETLRVQLEKREEAESQHEQERQKLEQDNNRLRQEAKNEAAVLQDQIADLKRQNDALREQVKRKLLDAPKVDAGNLNVANAVQDVNVIPKDNLQQHWKADNNRIPQIDGGNQQVIENKDDDNNHEVRMQIHGPDQGKKVAYFEPKPAKPDHAVDHAVVANVNAPNVNEAEKQELNVPHAEQVAPPRVDDGNDQNQQRNAGNHLADRLKRGAKARQNGIEAFGHPVNPVMPVAAVGMAQRRDTGFVAAAAAAAAGKDSRILRARDAVEDRHNVGRGVVEKPLQIAEPQLHQDEEDQLQGPGMRNERNPNEKDDGDEGEENDDDYQYDDGRRDKAAKKDSVNGPHAAPVDEDDDVKEGGLR